MRKIPAVVSVVAVIIAVVVAAIGWRAFGQQAPPRTPSIGAAVTGTRVGDRAPDFIIRVVGGPTIQLADFVGKKALVITSTATWCTTCIYEAEQFAAVYPEVRDRVEFLTVSIDPNEDALAIESFRTNLNTPWFYAIPTAIGVSDLLRAYRLDRFEVTYVIDRDGIIRFTDRTITDARTLREVLRSL